MAEIHLPTQGRPIAVPNSFPSPGFLYNVGDALGLAVGLGIALALARGSSGDAIRNFLFGDEGATALTVATIIFFGSGFTYSWAWRQTGAAHLAILRLADSISAFGAVILGISLLTVGEPLLALVSATAHSLGKLGSAVVAGYEEGADANRAFRWLVLGSRAVGLASCLPTLLISLAPSGQGLGSAALMSATLVLCYLLWIWADLLLLRDAG